MLYFGFVQFFMPMGGERNSTGGFETAQLSTSDADIESDMERDAHEEEQEEADEVDGNGEDGDFSLRLEGDINPFDYIETDASGVQAYQLSKPLEYEYLAERKRKSLADNLCKETLKKSKHEHVFGASFDELMEVMNYGKRRRSKKLKKRGRPKGSKNKTSPEITRMLGEGTLHYASGRYAEAIRVLSEVVRLAPSLPETYHTLGLVYNAAGEKQRAMDFYVLAAEMMHKNSSLWKLLLSWSLEQGDTSQAMYYISKAIVADPEDIKLRFHRASLYVELKDYEKAAKSYDRISQLHPDNVQAHRMAAKLYQSCGQVEQAVSILEDYLEHSPTEVDLNIIDMLATISMKKGEYVKALQHIELARSVDSSDKELPLYLSAKAGICHLHLGNMGEAEILFGALQVENAYNQVDLVIEVADSFKSLEHYESALNYYMILEKNGGHGDGLVHLKIAQCYLSLKQKDQAIQFFYKALHSLEECVDARLTLASLLEEGKEDEAILVLSPTNLELTMDTSFDKSKMWWLNEKVKVKLANIYHSKMMLEEFVNVIFPLIHKSLTMEATNKKIKAKKRLSNRELLERVKLVDDHQSSNVLRRFRPMACASDVSNAARAKRLLQEKLTLKEEMKAKALAEGLDWQSEDSDDEPPRQTLEKPLLPQLLEDEEHHQLIVYLNKALASLRRYREALDITKLTLRLASNKMFVEKKDELVSLGAQMAYSVMDPKHAYDFARVIVQQDPYSIGAWNCYYKVISRMGIHHSRHSRFLHKVRDK